MCLKEGGSNCSDDLPKDNKIYYEYEMCVWNYESDSQYRALLLVKVLVGFISPLGIIAGCYIVIFVRVSAIILSTSHYIW